MTHPKRRKRHHRRANRETVDLVSELMRLLVNYLALMEIVARECQPSDVDFMETECACVRQVLDELRLSSAEQPSETTASDEANKKGES
jgi:hypothetical protein